MRRVLCALFTLSVGLAGVGAWPSSAWPDDQGRARTGDIQGPGGRASAGARAYFPDVVLINQDGQSMRFYSDLLHGKVVVIATFYTSCTNTCPLIMATFARIQDAVGDRLGKDVHLIALTVDPERDTPPKLKEYAGRLRAKPGWYFLSGKKENVKQALYKLGQWVEDKESHLSIMIVGNERTGLWKKAFALAPSEQIVTLVEGVLNDR